MKVVSFTTMVALPTGTVFSIWRNTVNGGEWIGPCMKQEGSDSHDIVGAFLSHDINMPASSFGALTYEVFDQLLQSETEFNAFIPGGTTVVPDSPTVRWIVWSKKDVERYISWLS